MKSTSVSTPKSSSKKLLSLLVKIVVTIGCFWYISTKIDFTEAWKSVLKADWWLLFISVAFYFFSKLVSGFRLNINFRNIKLFLSEWENLKLYWLGMFYNLFLPGAISGDAYKVILLHKSYKAPVKKTSAAVLLDRFSGLLGLGVFLSLYGVLVFDNYLFEIAIVIAAALGIFLFYILLKLFFKEFLPGFLSTFFLGILVQGLQIVCVYFIMWSLDIPLEPQWIFIFLVSSAVSVLPISLGGGLGTRELVFAEGARYFLLKPELGIIISLLFYLSNLISSVGGLYFVFNSPLKLPNHTLANQESPQL